MPKDYNDKEETEYAIDDRGIPSIKLGQGVISFRTEVISQTDYNVGMARTIIPSSYTPEFEYIPIYNMRQTLDQLLEEFGKLKKENEEIKQKLTEITKKPEFVEIIDLPNNAIEEIIIDYLTNHPNEEIYPSDISFNYNLDAKKVFDICEKLKEEGKLL